MNLFLGLTDFLQNQGTVPEGVKDGRDYLWLIGALRGKDDYGSNEGGEKRKIILSGGGEEQVANKFVVRGASFEKLVNWLTITIRGGVKKKKGLQG